MCVDAHVYMHGCRSEVNGAVHLTFETESLTETWGLLIIADWSVSPRDRLPVSDYSVLGVRRVSHRAWLFCWFVFLFFLFCFSRGFWKNFTNSAHLPSPKK